MSNEERIQVTNQNALKLAVGLLNSIVNQNKLIIGHLQAMNGLLSKLPSNDIKNED